MRRFAHRSIRLLGIALIAGLVPASVLAQAPKKASAAAGEQWVQLFNGKDLTGWVEVGKEKWTVEDGVIHGQGVTNAYGYLRTEKRVQGLLAVAALQVRSRRQQRRLHPHRVQGGHRRRQPGQAVRDRSHAEPPHRRALR